MQVSNEQLYAEITELKALLLERFPVSHEPEEESVEIIPCRYQARKDAAMERSEHYRKLRLAREKKSRE